MENITFYISEKVFTDFLEIVITYGVGGAFAFTTLLIFTTMIVFKALRLLNNNI